MKVYDGKICEHDVDRLRELLHRFWGSAIGEPDYVKDEWKEFQALIEKFCTLANLVIR